MTMKSNNKASLAESADDAGKTDLLLRFFESRYFDEWIALLYLYQNNTAGVQDYLSNKLYDLPEEGISKFLLQFTYLAVSRPGSPLERVLVDLCMKSLSISMKVYWLVLALHQDHPKVKHIEQLLEQVETAAMEGDWEVPFFHTSECCGASQYHHTHRFQRSFQMSNCAVCGAETALATRSISSYSAGSGGDGSCDLDPSGIPHPLPHHQDLSTTRIVGPGSDGRSWTGGGATMWVTPSSSLQERMQCLKQELGEGEGVTGLLQRSKLQAAQGGNGIVIAAEESITDDASSTPLSPLRKLRQDTFGSTLDFIEALCDASSKLTRFPQEERQQALRGGLEGINQEIEYARRHNVSILFPMGSGHEQVLRVTAKEAVLLNSREKAPFMLFLEVLEHPSSLPCRDSDHNCSPDSHQPIGNGPIHEASDLSPSTQPPQDHSYPQSLHSPVSPFASKALQEGLAHSSHPRHHHHSPNHHPHHSSRLGQGQPAHNVGPTTSSLQPPPAVGTPVRGTSPQRLQQTSYHTSSLTSPLSPLRSSGGATPPLPLGSRGSSGGGASGGASELVSKVSGKLRSLRNIIGSTDPKPAELGGSIPKMEWSLTDEDLLGRLTGAPPPPDTNGNPVLRKLDDTMSSLKGEAPLVRVHIKVLEPMIQEEEPSQNQDSFLSQPSVASECSITQKAAGSSGADLSATASNVGENPADLLVRKSTNETDASGSRAPWILSKFGWCRSKVDENPLPAMTNSHQKLVTVRFEVAGGINLAITSPHRKSRRVPSHEAIDIMAGRFKVPALPPPYQSGPPLGPPGVEATIMEEPLGSPMNSLVADLGNELDLVADVPMVPDSHDSGAITTGDGVSQIKQHVGNNMALANGLLTPNHEAIGPPSPSEGVAKSENKSSSTGGTSLANSASQRVTSAMQGALQAAQALLSLEHPVSFTQAVPVASDAGTGTPVAAGKTRPKEVKESWRDKKSREASAVYGERWAQKAKRIQRESPVGHRPGWALRCVIVKSGDDCRQELMAVQLVKVFHDIFRESGLSLYVHPYDVLVTSNRTALIELVPDSLSIHTIKSRSPPGTSLSDHFFAKFKRGTVECVAAQRRFTESLAGYSLMTYILQLKDRHNGNILMTDEGQVVHIDFGFMLSNNPGGVNFETAPFKLTRELLEVMDSNSDGKSSEMFDYFKVLCIKGFIACRKHQDRIVYLVKMMSRSGFPCFKAGEKAVRNLEKRLHLHLTEVQCINLVLQLISDSLDAWRTRQYDYYQRVLNGIL